MELRHYRAMFLNLSRASESPVGPVKTQIAGLHSQSLRFHRFRVRSEICMYNRSQRMLMLMVRRPSLRTAALEDIPLSELGLGSSALASSI